MFEVWIYLNLRLVIIALVVVLYLIYWYRRPQNCPPGPRGIPSLGYLPFMGDFPEKTLFKLSEKYGKIFTIRMGAEDVIILNDYDSIHAVSTKSIVVEIVAKYDTT